MLKQATVEDVRSARVTRRHGKIIVVTRYYPRYLKKNLIDEYAAVLAPPLALLREFKDREKLSGDHDGAFADIDYESKFTLSREGIERLRHLAESSGDQDIYLVCHCAIGRRCHREILLLLANERFGAKIPKLHFSWTRIKARLPELLPRDADP